MYIKFFFLTAVILTFATDISWSYNYQFYGKGGQLLLNSIKNTKPIKRDDEQLQSQESKDNRSIMDKNIKIRKKESIDPWNLSEEINRIQFQIEGHEGPQTYIFGFDTGHGKNRQYRLEERHRDGTINGQYGYYDAKGKLKRVRYVAKPFEGYTEIHHESNIQKREN